MIPTDFRTDRLTAERLRQDHLDDLVALHLDPEVCRHLGGVRSAQHTADYLEANLAHWDRHGFGLWVVRTQDGAFAGRAGIRWLELDGRMEMEIAYTLRREAWGRGLATELSHRLVAIWHEARPSPSLIGIASLENTASRHVLQKVGLTYERDAAHFGEAVALYRLALSPPAPPASPQR